MIHIADEYGIGLAALAAAVGTERWVSFSLLLFATLFFGLYLWERRLRRLDLARHRVRRDSELGALNAMAGISSRTFDLDEILKSTAHCTRELFGQHCDILLFDLDGGGVSRSLR